MRNKWGHFGKASATLSLSFVSQSAYERSIAQRLGLHKQVVSVQHCRSVGKKDLIHTQALPSITVDPETYVVKADGRILACAPATVLPLAQQYFLFC